MIGIYKITSPTGQVYVGQSKDVERRFKSYKTMTSSVNGKLKNSFIKHGSNNHVFEIIEECTLDELNDRERFWQDKLNSIHDGLNSNKTNPVVKRTRRLAYGEHTAMLSIRVPKSKKEEINNRFYSILDEYLVSSLKYNSENMDGNVEKKSNPANDTLELVVNHKAPEWATKHKQVIKTETSKFKVEKIEPQVFEDKIEYDLLESFPFGIEKIEDYGKNKSLYFCEPDYYTRVVNEKAKHISYESAVNYLKSK